MVKLASPRGFDVEYRGIVPKVKSCWPHRRLNTAGPRLGDPAWRSRGSSNEHPPRARPVPRYRAANEGDQRVQPLRPATCIPAPPDRKKVSGTSAQSSVSPFPARLPATCPAGGVLRRPGDSAESRASLTIVVVFLPSAAPLAEAPVRNGASYSGEYSYSIVLLVHAKRRARGHDAGRVARGRARERDSVAE